MKKKVGFEKVQKKHIDFLNSIMKDYKTRDLSLNQKTLLINQKFPALNISRATVYKI